jgi:hypothetical protein
MNLNEVKKEIGQTKLKGCEECDYKFLIDYIEVYRPKFIVEYGSGVSTYIIDKLIGELDYGAEFISFEDDKYWYEIIKDEGLDVNNRVQLVDLEYERISSKSSVPIGDSNLPSEFTYSACRYKHSYVGFENVDFVIIDGPDVNKRKVSTTLNLYDIVKKYDIRPFFWIDYRKTTKRFYAEFDLEYTCSKMILNKNDIRELKLWNTILHHLLLKDSNDIIDFISMNDDIKHMLLKQI